MGFSFLYIYILCLLLSHTILPDFAQLAPQLQAWQAKFGFNRAAFCARHRSELYHQYMSMIMNAIFAATSQEGATLMADWSFVLPE